MGGSDSQGGVTLPRDPPGLILLTAMEDFAINPLRDPRINCCWRARPHLIPFETSRKRANFDELIRFFVERSSPQPIDL